jgi:hypothetical protein
LNSQVATEISGPRFAKKYSNVGQLLKDEKEFCISLICSLSDITAQDCVRLLDSTDDGADSNAKIICADTQLEFSTKLGDIHMTKDVFWKLIHKLHGRYGNRLTTAKKYGIIHPNFSLNLLAVSPYKLKADEQFFTDVNFNTIMPNTPGLDFAALKITRDFQLKNVWTDLQVAFVKQGLAATKLETFFMKSTGPKLLPPPTKPAVLDDISAVCLQEYMREMDARGRVANISSVSGSGGDGSRAVVAQEVARDIKAIDEKNKAVVYFYM